MTQSYPASYQHRQFWWLHNLDPKSSAYAIPLIFQIKGNLDYNRLNQSFNALIHDHEVFRISFSVNNTDGLNAVINEHNDITIPVIDNSEDSSDLDESIYSFISSPFDLQSGPLVRSQLIRTVDTYYWCIAIHHSVVDLKTKDLLCRFISQHYNHTRKNRKPTLEGPLTYEEYAHTQHQFVASEESAAMSRYWQKALSNVSQSLSLPSDFPRPSVLELTGTIVPFSLDMDQSQCIEDFAKKHAVTPFLVFLTAYGLLLSRYIGKERFLIGVPFTNRKHPGTKETMGCFVNVVPVLFDISDNPTMLECMGTLRRTMLLAHRNQDFPTELIIKEVLNDKHVVNQSPLFQVGFTFEPLSDLHLEECQVEPRYYHHGGAQLDLFATLWKRDGAYNGVFEYNSKLFKPETVKRWIANYLSTVQTFIDRPDLRAHTFPVTSSTERQKLLRFVGPRTTREPVCQTLSEIVEEKTRTQPHHPALVFGDNVISYEELHSLLLIYSSILFQENVGPNQVVALCIDRSIEMVAAMLATLHRGAAYLPLDPDFPQERTEFILKDAGVTFAITQDEYAEIFSQNDIPHITIESIDDNQNYETTEISPSAYNPESIAYVIYTSGSTGVPKGVVISQANLNNFIHSMVHEPGIEPSDRILAVTTISFDIHVLELLAPLAAGATIVIAPNETLVDASALYLLLEESGATMMQATPTTWRLLCAIGWKGSESFRALCGGELMPRDLAESLVERCGEVWNMYGPTETTVWSTCHRIKEVSGPIPVGRPIENTSAFIVDTWGNLAPVGVWGELWIGGTGVGKGYHQRRELTEKKFIANPLATHERKRVFRTGDICRFSDSGDIEYSARMDHQVKIRGFRIELEEIEHILRQHSLVQQAAVVVRHSQNVPVLVAAIVVKKNSNSINRDDIRSFSRKKLPEYMVPSHVAFITSIPLTPNNKIDRKTLEKLVILPVSATITTEQVPQKTGLESRLAEIWARCLSLQNIGIEENFFDAGGNSLLLMHLKEAISTDLNMAIPVTVLLQYPSISSLARYCEQQKDEDLPTNAIAQRAQQQRKAFLSRAKHHQKNRNTKI